MYVREHGLYLNNIHLTWMTIFWLEQYWFFYNIRLNLFTLRGEKSDISFSITSRIQSDKTGIHLIKWHTHFSAWRTFVNIFPIRNGSIPVHIYTYKGHSVCPVVSTFIVFISVLNLLKSIYQHSYYSNKQWSTRYYISVLNTQHESIHVIVHSLRVPCSDALLANTLNWASQRLTYCTWYFIIVQIR
jgi:hypothetical protein